MNTNMIKSIVVKYNSDVDDECQIVQMLENIALIYETAENNVSFESSDIKHWYNIEVHYDGDGFYIISVIIHTTINTGEKYHAINTLSFGHGCVGGFIEINKCRIGQMSIDDFIKLLKNYEY